MYTIIIVSPPNIVCYFDYPLYPLNEIDDPHFLNKDKYT